MLTRYVINPHSPGQSGTSANIRDLIMSMTWS
jgi:hypothetical protein